MSLKGEQTFQEASGMLHWPRFGQMTLQGGEWECLDSIPKREVAAPTKSSPITKGDDEIASV